MKLITLLTVVILIAAVVSGLLFYIFSVSPGTPNTANSPSKDVQEQQAKETATATKKQTIDNASQSTSKSSSDAHTIQPSVSIQFTYLGQSNTTYTIRTLINRVFASGTCTLTLTQGTRQVTRSVDIQAQSSSSTCKGFDIPLSDLGTGTWRLDLNLSGDGVTSTATQSIEVK